MTLQFLESLREFFAPIAILTIVIYLAVQVRQNTKAVKATSHHAVSDSFNQINVMIGADPKVDRLVRLGSRDLQELDEDERVSYSMIMLAYLRVFETLYYQWRSGATEEQLFQSEIKSIAYLFREQGARDWWQGNMISFSLEFKTFVDSVISKTQIEETDLVVD